MYESDKLTFVIKIIQIKNNLGKQNPLLNTLNLFTNRELSFLILRFSPTKILCNSWTPYSDKEVFFLNLWPTSMTRNYRKISENHIGSVLPCLCILRLRYHFQLKTKLLQGSKVGAHLSWAKAQTKMDAHKCPDLLFQDPPLWTWAWLHNESQAVWHSCHRSTKTLHITFSHQIPRTL